MEASVIEKAADWSPHTIKKWQTKFLRDEAEEEDITILPEILEKRP